MPKYRIGGKIYEAENPEQAYAMSDAAPEPIMDDFTESAPPSGENYALETLKNVPGSAWQLAKDTTAIVHSFGEVTDAMWKIGKGVVDKARPGEQENEKYADAAWMGLKERYGGWDKLKETFKEDPVGLMADFAGALATFGALPGLKQVGRLGSMIDPVRAAGKALPKAVPAYLYGSALKPAAKTAADRQGMIRTGLDNRLMPTVGGTRKLTGLKAELGTQIDALIKQVSKSAAPVPLSALLSGMGDIAKRLGPPRIEAGRDLAEMNKIVQEWIDTQRKHGQMYLTPENLQQFKTDAWSKINFNRSQQSASIPKEEVYGSMGTQARKNIERVAPETAGINEQWGKLAELEVPLNRAAGRVANRDLMGIGPSIKATAGSSLGGGSQTGAVIGAISGILDAPRTKSALALSLEALRTRGTKGNRLDKAITALQAALAQGGRAQDDPERQGYLYGPR